MNQPSQNHRFAPGSRRLTLSTWLFILLLSVTFLHPVKAQDQQNPKDAGNPAIYLGETGEGNFIAALSAFTNMDYKEAVDYIRLALEEANNDPFLLDVALYYAVVGGDLELAAVWARQVLQFNPVDRIAHLTLGIHAVKRGHFKTARTHFLKSRLEGRDTVIDLIRAWCFYATGQYDIALRLIDEALEAGESVSLINIHRFIIASQIGDQERAQETLQRIAANPIQIPPRFFGVYASYLKTVTPDERRRRIEEIAALLPSFFEIGYLNDLVESDQAIPLVEFSAARGISDLLEEIGIYVFENDDHVEALGYNNMSTYLSPENENAIYALAENYYSMASMPGASDRIYAKAVEQYRKVLSSKLYYRSAVLKMARLLEILDRGEEVDRLYSEFLTRYPQDTVTAKNFAEILHLRKDFVRAINVITTTLDAVADDASLWPLYFERGRNFERNGQWPPAESDFKKALELEPDQPDVLNYLGYSWVDMGIHLDEGFEMIKKAVEQRPNAGFIVDSLGWAYFKLGQYEDAVRELETAVSLSPEDSVIMHHLGDAYWKVGRTVEAYYIWDHALQQESDEKQKAIIEQKIKQGYFESN